MHYVGSPHHCYDNYLAPHAYDDAVGHDFDTVNTLTFPQHYYLQ